MDRQTLIEMVSRLYHGGDDDDDVNMRLLTEIEGYLPHSHISDLISQDMRNLTPEQAVDEALQQEADFHRKQAGRSQQ